jgi:hypothetical protein
MDGAQGIVSNDQIVKINLFQDRLVGEGGTRPSVPLDRVICARLVMTPQVFKELTIWLSKYAAVMFPEGI